MLSAAIPFPQIDPEIFRVELGGFAFALRWYALAYIAGILIGWRIVWMTLQRPALWRNDEPPMTASQLESLMTWVIIGIIAGGRLGFVLFYQPAYFAANPGDIAKVWQGGMSFHGGFLGVVLATLIYSWRQGLRLGSISDLMALGTPAGLLLGRLANFINAELWGRPSDVPWAVIFPGDAAQDCPGVTGLCARHPSQLYEAGLEGLILGAFLLWLAFFRGALKHPWLITGLFLAGYGLSRFIVEFYRQADAQFITTANPMGHVLDLGFTGLSMGQLLSLPMILVGLWAAWLARPTDTEA